MENKCKEPQAYAYDHHDGDLTSKVSTTYTLFVRSDPQSSPRDVNEVHKALRTDLRGEYVIQYDVVDSNGNQAEQVQFALIFIDEVAPRFLNSPSTFIDQGDRLYQSPPSKKYNRYATDDVLRQYDSHCVSNENCRDNYRTYYREFYSDSTGRKQVLNNIVLELCGNLALAGISLGAPVYNLYWANDANNKAFISSHDAYDGLLDQRNSGLTRSLDYKIDYFHYNAIDDFFYDEANTNAPNIPAKKDMRFPVPMYKIDGSGRIHTAQLCMAEIKKATKGKCDVASLMSDAQAIVNPSADVTSPMFNKLRDHCVSCTTAYKNKVNAKGMTKSACYTGIQQKKFNNWFCGRPALQFKPEGRSLAYSIATEDFADIFGKNNQNNINQEAGKIFFQDSIIPTLVMPETEVCLWESTGTHLAQNPLTKAFEKKAHTVGTGCHKSFQSQGCKCGKNDMCTDWNNEACALVCTASGQNCWNAAAAKCKKAAPWNKACPADKAALDFQCRAEGAKDIAACMTKLCCMNKMTIPCKTDTALTNAPCSSANTVYECGFAINHKPGEQRGSGKVAFKSRDPVTGEWIDSYRPATKYVDCYDTHTKNLNWVNVNDLNNPLFDFDFTSANWVGLEDADAMGSMSGCKKSLPHTDPIGFRKTYDQVIAYLKKGTKLDSKTAAYLKKVIAKSKGKTHSEVAKEVAKGMHTSELPITPYVASKANKYNALWAMKEKDCVARCVKDVSYTLVKHTKDCKAFCASVAKYHGPRCFSQPQDVTLRYNVNDNFGNHATEKYTKIGIVDTLAPTLYITKHDYVEAEGLQYSVDRKDYEACDDRVGDNLDSKTGHFKRRSCEGVRFCFIAGAVHTGKICAGKTMHGRYEHQTIDHSKKLRNKFTGTIYNVLPENTGCTNYCQQRVDSCKALDQKPTVCKAGEPGCPANCPNAKDQKCWRYACEQLDTKCDPKCAHYAGEYLAVGWQRNPEYSEATLTPFVEHQYMEAEGYTKAHWVNVGGKTGEEEWLKSGQTMLQVASNVNMKEFYNTYADQMVVQHSAGYAGDYKWIEELLKEGTGYECFDACSDTTTTVEWHTSCSSNKVGNRFEMKVPGTYFLKYSCVDEKGDNLKANEITACRTFYNIDRTRPVLEVFEAANNADGFFHVEASRDNNYVDAGASCSDIVDGIITSDVQVSGDVVNMAAVGTYIINYDCEDDAGRQAYQAHRTVVVEDTTCPSCSIPGNEATITVEASFPYSEETSTCSDNIDGYIGKAQRHGTVDVELTGTYVLTYTATDANNNGFGMKTKCKGKTYTSKGWQVNQPAHTTKTVIVEDTMVPIISLKYKKDKLMAETTTNNAWVIGAVASAISGVALLGYAATRQSAASTTVPV